MFSATDLWLKQPLAFLNLVCSQSWVSNLVFVVGFFLGCILACLGKFSTSQLFLVDPMCSKAASVGYSSLARVDSEYPCLVQGLSYFLSKIRIT